MNARPSVPTALQRQLFIEAGYKCSIPVCGTTTPLEIDHIEDWSRVQEHKYENLIVLCANHHGMKNRGGKRGLDSAALKVIKQNQIEVNGRYGDVERRVLDYFVRTPDARRVHLPGDFDLLLSRLLDADFLTRDTDTDGNVAISILSDSPGELEAGQADTTVGTHGYEHNDELGAHLILRRAYTLTTEGRAYVVALREARSVTDS